MYVKSWMTKKIISVDENTPIDKARILLRENRYQMLPVTQQERLVGALTCSEIINALTFNSEQAKTVGKDTKKLKTEVKDIMIKKVVTVATDFTIEEVAGLLLKNNIFSAPVIDREGELAGIITHSDIARALICLSAGHKGGILYGFILEDRAGSIKDISDMIRAHGGRLASILTSIIGAPDGKRKVYIRVYGIDRFNVRRLNESLESKDKAELFMISERLEIGKEFRLDH